MRALFVLLAVLSLLPSEVRSQTPEEERGKDIFQACHHCHNVLTDARRAGPSLRTLFGKVRLVNGKRTLEQNVTDLIIEGFNGMPSYRYMLRESEFRDLLAYLKTLRARPEIGPILKPIRGTDQDILSAGKRHFSEHCASCHDGSDTKVPDLLNIYSRESLSSGEPVKEATIIPRIRDGHGGMPPKKDVLDDAALFSLIALLKAK